MLEWSYNLPSASKPKFLSQLNFLNHLFGIAKPMMKWYDYDTAIIIKNAPSWHISWYPRSPWNTHVAYWILLIFQLSAWLQQTIPATINPNSPEAKYYDHPLSNNYINGNKTGGILSLTSLLTQSRSVWSRRSSKNRIFMQCEISLLGVPVYVS